jgi:hypothetical protein
MVLVAETARPTPIEFPEPPQAQTIMLPGGATLTGMVSLPKSMEEGCEVNFNLMLALGPLLSISECVMKIIKFCGWLIEFVNEVPKLNPIGLAEKVGELPPIASDLTECILGWTPLGICPFVKSILKLISSFLHCLIDFLEGIFDQQLKTGIKLQRAYDGDNTDLIDCLQVAQENNDKARDTAFASAASAFGLLELVTPFLEVLGQPSIQTPSLNELAGGTPDEMLQPFKDVLAIIDTIIKALPC